MANLTLRANSVTGGTIAGRELTYAELDANWDYVTQASSQRFTPSGTGAQSTDVQTKLQRLVHTSEYDTTAHFNSAVAALSGSTGVRRLVWQTKVSTLATFTAKYFDGGSPNDTFQIGYNQSETLYTPNDTTEPQIWWGMESNYPNNPARDAGFGTDPTCESYWRFGRIGSSTTDYLEPLFFNFDRSTNQIIRGDIRAEHLTLGNSDYSTKYLEITSAAWTMTVNGDFVATRALGDAGAGFGNTPMQWLVTWTGNSSASSRRGHLLSQAVSGSNAITTADTMQVTASQGASATVTNISGVFNEIDVTSTGSVTNAKGFRNFIKLSNSGNITQADGFVVEAPTLSSTGLITTYAGFHVNNIGHATLVGTAAGFKCDDITGSATATYGLHLNISSGTGKYNVRIDGNASNYVAGGWTIYANSAIPAGGTTGVGYTFSNTGNYGIFFGSGAPTLSAAKGSLYLRSDGTTTNDRAYINTNGSTTWTAITTAA